MSDECAKKSWVRCVCVLSLLAVCNESAKINVSDWAVT